MSADEIDNTFTYHPPNTNQAGRYHLLRDAAKALAHLINDNTPPCREQSLAITSLQQSVMWANAAIALHE